MENANSFFKNFNIEIEGLDSLRFQFLDQFAEQQRSALSLDFAGYIIATQAKKSFARYIVESDKNLEFHARTTKEEKDPQAVKEALIKYQKEKNEMEALLSKWKAENEDLFTFIPFVPSVSVYAKDFSFVNNFSVEEAIQGYKISSAICEYIKKNKAQIQVASKKVILPEYKSAYDLERERIQNQVGFPGESAIKASVTKTIEVPKTRLKLNRQPYSTAESFMVYAKSYAEYLSNFDFSVKVGEEEDGEDSEE